jgi:hypothetical protein
MVERQRLSGGLFANMGVPSPQKDDAPSPMELHSDALTADDLPTNASRTTPLKALAAMGPMDVFLGSSPTPHARRSTHRIVSDETSLATPTTIRTVNMVDNNDLGSSPPRFEKAAAIADRLNSDVRVGSSFEYRQPEISYDMSFDEGTTIDEEALLAAVALDTEAEGHPEVEQPHDTIMSELPSSTIDLQLTAQLDADIQAHTAVTEDTGKPAPESINEFVDAASHPQSSMVDKRGSDTKVDDSQPPSSAPAKVARDDTEVDTSSTSRVGDSFSKPSSDRGTPRSKSRRRSSRHSTASSPAQSPSMKKRKSAKLEQKGNRVNEKQDQAPAQQSTQPDDDGMLDNIIVASPAPRQTKATKKRKSMSNAESAHIDVPNTHKKRGPVRRSQSLLSQVENSQDILVEDTPAPKRAKQTASQDVSAAKNTPPPPPPTAQNTLTNSQPKRLSHVQVTPKRSSEYASSIRSPSLATDIAPPTNDAPAPEPHIWSPASVQTPSRSFTERVILTPRSIINQLKSLKDYLFSAGARDMVIGREEEREIDDALFDIRRVVHAAGVRGEERRGRD